MQEIKKIKELVFDGNNINKGSDYGQTLLEKSLKEVGAGRSVLIDKNGVVIAGNQTIAKAGELGFEDVIIVPTDGKTIVAVQRTDIDINSPEGVKMKILDNTVSRHNYVEDAEVMEAVCHEYHIDAVSYGLEVKEDKNAEAKEDDYEIPDEVKTDIVLGDLFEIGPHKLLCGSSTETDTWAKLMGEALADLVVTDPPYNVAYEGKTKDALTIKNDSMSDDSFYQFLYDFYTALGSFTKAGGSWYVWHADSEGANFRQAMKDAGIMVKQCLIWVKNSMVMGRQDYQWKHEPCLYGWKEGAAHSWFSDRKQTTILEFDRPTRNAEHPTMKPIPLIAYQIGNSSKSGDIVADGFLGSGTTMVAAHQLHRKCYGLELDPKYCQVIVDRMRKLDPALEIKRNGEVWNP